MQEENKREENKRRKNKREENKREKNIHTDTHKKEKRKERIIK